MVRSPWVSFLIVGLFSFLLSGSAFAAACEQTDGEIELPWGPVAPHGFDGIGGLHGVFFYQIVNIEPGAEFHLGPKDQNSGILCVGPDCLVHHPDYNVAFYQETGTVHTRLATFDEPGSVVGEVPDDADYALVWMRTGLHQPLLGDLASTEDEFTWRLCS